MTITSSLIKLTRGVSFELDGVLLAGSGISEDDGAEIDSPWGVDGAKLVPLLVKELQELRRRVALLEGK